MVREDILNWLKVAISRGENANDAAMRLISAGHDMYEVNDALRQITFEISDKRFDVNTSSFKDSNKKTSEPKKGITGPRPSSNLPELPNAAVKNGKKNRLSKRTVLILTWTVMALITVLTAYLIYLMTA